ncbi:DUF5313 family protein [Bailinhaonella thermotolerans]|uniref:DUF5313 domain-containing protein n=1 Tax=Bailinhaonella thermotolerans TaxID=1070861 RepID=A0A3A4B0S4_9ACTN|nr:DUF5313 family protein [Bailinhaonella thermotolerans]RJL33538.1 hypothetical protein D5H75_12295 [Bailinhaonella thermotolerans]
MTGDPGLWGKLRFALGFRLPDVHRDWVRHELLDAGWRGRMLGRELTVILPICGVLALLPGSWWVHLAVPALVFLPSLFAIAVHADTIRDARLRQHRLTTPEG